MSFLVPDPPLCARGFNDSRSLTSMLSDNLERGVRWS